MKIIIIFILALCSIVETFSQDTISKNEIIFNNDKQLFYQYSNNLPFTGYVYEELDSYKYFQNLDKGKIKYVNYYYNSGQKWKTVYLGNHGEEHGRYIEYYINGNKMVSGKYYYGNKIAIWKFWSSDGKLCKREKYNIAGNVINSKKLLECK